MSTRPAPAKSFADINLRAGLQMKEYDTIVDRILADGPANVLDWGCGHGQMSSLLRRRGVETSAYDYHPELGDGEMHPLERYPEIEALLGGDGVLLPYESDSFDGALSCGVLEHVENPDGSLDELRRVLKPGGWLYVYKLPNRASWTEWIARRLGGRVFYHGMAPYDHLYGLDEARALLERHGFRVVEARYANVLPLLLPVSVNSRTAKALWALNEKLGRVRGLNRLSSNVELVARAG